MDKRRFHININWRIIGYVFGLAATVAGIVLLQSAVAVKSSEQACTELRVMIVGEEAFVEQKDIVALINDHYGQLVGRTLGSIPIHEIEQHLRTIPYVSDARVHVDMNGILYVRIGQRKAILRILDAEGGGFYVDEQGLKMPVSPSYIPRVPVANGAIDEVYDGPLDTVETALVRDLFAIAQVISTDSLWTRQVVQLHVNQESEIELIPRLGDFRILFGDGQDLEEKFERVRIFYTGVVPKTGLEAYQLVNVKYRDQLVCVRNPAFQPANDSTQHSADSLRQTGSISN